MRSVLLLALSLVLALPQALAQEGAFAVRATEVKKEPFSDAETVGKLAEKAPVKILRRQGGWTQIESGAPPAALVGWVRMLALRTGTGAQPAGGDSGVKELFNVARTGSSGTAVATGVRGLDKETIQNAQPNPAELQKLATFGAARPDAEQFAAGDPPLKPQAIEYFAAPAPRVAPAQQ